MSQLTEQDHRLSRLADSHEPLKRASRACGAFGFQRCEGPKRMDVISRGAGLACAALIGTVLALHPAMTLGAEDSTQKTEAAETIAAGDVYRLNVSDKVRIQVFEWRPARDELFTWTALNQVYSIDPAGTLSLPLIGQVKAAGYSTSELATLISHKLAKRMNLGAVPHATVEVTEFRPIFVTGHVERAGEYPFAPGMTVLQGISRGGGLYKGGGVGGARLEREFLTTSGTYDRLLQERERLIVRKARLEAELAHADRIAFPADLRMTRRPYKIEFTASLMSKEQSVFELRRRAYETQVTALRQLQNFLEQEVETLAKRLDAHQTQIDLMKAELSGIEHLTDRGLATQPRLLAMKRNLAQLEGERLRMESERTRARQEVSRVVLSKIEFENKRANDLTVELQQAEARLQTVSQEASVTERLLVETRAQAAQSPVRLASSGDDGIGKPAITYTIARLVKGGVIEIEANESTLLQPGDTIKVMMTPPRGDFIGGLYVDITGTPKETEIPASTTVDPAKAPHQAAIEKIRASGGKPTPMPMPR
jgi:protein involved in polysaccharide export with SLBB domain